MIQYPMHMYIIIWVVVSSSMIMLCYGLLRRSTRRVTKQSPEKLEVGEKVHSFAQKRTFVDRRSGDDRRKAHDLDYFLRGGVERRCWKERRSEIERRKDWIRAATWVSVKVSELERDMAPITFDT